MKLGWFIAALFTFQAWAATEQVVRPNPDVTPGELCNEQDPDFREHRYEEKIPYCVRAVSWDRKSKIFEMYGIPKRCRHEYTVDHFIPLAMGGSNNDMNLWPEHKHVKATRQNLEQQLYYELRDGMINQKTAVEEIIEAKMNPPAVEPWNCD